MKNRTIEISISVIWIILNLVLYYLYHDPYDGYWMIDLILINIIFIASLLIFLISLFIFKLIMNKWCPVTVARLVSRAITNTESNSCIYLACGFVMFQPLYFYSNHEVAPDIWHDLVGDYFKVSWGGGSNLLI